ncbi:hypothetical protein [Agromyces atrinae]|uniref:DUF4131 domain-containing protein n=1 Tax=Agromyces atrinae TaxID=592376 RepID=A0A4Q2M8J4_9MICO|nr:hypothetical protein [Agromyces atrinae]NYD65978.1 hypothetical protein [Agromyces atrinae]RXZ86311.1 hypothetical protein ESP50_11175 [Agromyces atrinae]
MTGRDLRLVAPACVAWAVAWVLTLVTEWSLVVAIALSVVAFASIVLSRRRAVAAVAVAASAGVLVAVAVCAALPGRESDALDEAAEVGGVVEATVELTQNPRIVTASFGPWADDAESTRVRFDAVLREAEVAGSTVRGAIPVQVVGAVDGALPVIGSRVTATATVRVSEPGDSSAYRLFASESIALVAPPPGFLGWADPLRSGFRELTATLPGGGGELLPGLAIGDTSRVSTELDEAMKVSSLTYTKLRRLK